jgi:hypothetical protein
MRLALLLVVLVSACGTEEIRDGVVDPLRAPCVGEGYFLCVQLHETAGGQPRLIYGELEGYAHRWGVEARVRYHVETIDDPPADGSSRRYVVDDVVSEIEDVAGREFALSFPQTPPGTGWFTAAGAGQLDMSGTAVACDPIVCNDILNRAEARAGFSVRFQIAGPDALRALRLE